MKFEKKNIKLFFSKQSESIVNIIILVSIFIFLLIYFKPELILLKTTASGGDMGSMNYLAKFMRDDLLPEGKIFGWSQGRWAGYPIFQFIPPLCYVIIALLSYAIPLEIAFKIITVSGVFLLPIASFFAMKFMKFKFPVPILAAIFSLLLLFNEKNLTFGANIPSVLAGEFSYSFSFSLMVLFIGYLYKVVSEKKFSAKATILLVAVIMSHIVTAIIAILSSAYFLLTKNKKKLIGNFKLLFLIIGFALAIVSFWIIPAALRISYTTGYGGDWPLDNFFSWFPREAPLFFALAILGTAIAIKRKDSRIFFLLFILLVSLLGFYFGEKLFTANIRYWPMMYFFILMIATTPLELLTEKKIQKRLGKIIPIIPILVLLITVAWIKNNTSFIDYWIKWNYSGFESKDMWPTYEGINDILKDTQGRAYCDLADANDKFGTPRAFESLPYFSGRPTLEGVYAQSTITSPFISYTQCEISHHCAGIPKVAGIERTTYHNITAGTMHLEKLNVKYLIASYDLLREELSNSPQWKLVKDYNEWQVYELLTHDGHFVVVPQYLPNLIVEKNVEMRKKISLDWWKDTNLLEFPIAYVSNTDGENMSRFGGEITNISDIVRTKIDNNCIINESVKNEEISFTTTCIGNPHIIEVSYYPNWKVEGADKIYFVSPSFMLVYPNQQNVRLYYSRSTEEIIFGIVSIMALFVVIFHKKFFVLFGSLLGSKNRKKFLS